MVYPHSGHPLAEGRVQDRSLPAKDRCSANCATQPTELEMVTWTVVNSTVYSTISSLSLVPTYRNSLCLRKCPW